MDIKKFIENSYKSDNFIEFITNGFNGFELHNSEFSNEYLNEQEKENIEFYRYLGSVKLKDDKEIGIFEFKAKNSNIANKRVGFNSILKKLALDYVLDGAIATFFHTDSELFRLSFVGIEYNIDKTDITNLKRYSFVLGKDVATKTALIQLKKLNSPDYKTLKTIFSVEAVTKEFYKGLEKIYFNLLNSYLSYPDNDENKKKEFGIKLIGRIIFIKFLEKKSLIPSTIFELKEDYYFSVLEPLFFEQLNKDEKNRFEKFKNGSIPFLNGGLFEPIKNIDFYNFDEKLSERVPSVSINGTFKIDDKFFKELFELFSQFNFTIDENTPNDNELSIDPEMLGRVFENFIAEINPETSENARKETGSYYTPREIVDYMVSKTIFDYLKVSTNLDENLLKNFVFKDDEIEVEFSKKSEILTALFKIKVLDPACGSGAFPMGILHKLVELLNKIDKNSEIWFQLQDKEFQTKYKNKDKNYFRKLSIINNSIFGIDIQPIAVEIAKIRFFLSLVVDEEIDDKKENRGIEPLPNLEFKFVCANSLLSLKKNNSLSSEEYRNYENRLKELKNEYFLSSGVEKEKIKKEYLEVRTKLFNEIENINLGEALDSELANYNPFDPLSVAHFFDSEFMFNIKDGFDIVIGNPPYIRQENIKNKDELKKDGYRCYNGMADIYIYFFERGFDFLSKNGVLSYITSNKYTRAKYGKKFREFLLKNSDIKEYIDFNGIKVFESATVDSSILSFSHKENIDNYLNYCLIKEDYKKEQNLFDYIQQNFIPYPQSSLSSDIFSFSSLEELKIKEYIEKIGTPLKEWDIKIYRGILTGLNEAFIIDRDTKENLIKQDSKSAEIIKPILRGRDIKRYGYEFGELYLINSHNNPPIDVKNSYPAIYKYFLQYKDRLKKRADKGKNWWNLRNCAYLEEFEKEKIVYPETSQNVNFYFEIKKFFIDKTVFMITGKKLKYIYALISSRLLTMYFKNYCGGAILGKKGYQYNKHALEKLPIPKIPKEKQKPFEQFVDIMQEVVSKEDKEKEEFFQTVIDLMVIQLYFEDDFKSKNLDILSLVTEDLKSSTNLNTLFEKWSKEESEISKMKKAILSFKDAVWKSILEIK